MAEFDEKTREIIIRLQRIRVKLLREQPFYAVLLMHLKFALDEATPTLYTDGERIAFNPYFIEELSDEELQFVLMHEILHVALGHCEIEQGDFDHEMFNVACDIVVNSNILYSLGLTKKGFKLRGETVMHTAPNNVEGYEMDALEVYNVLMLLYPVETPQNQVIKEMEDLSQESDEENEEGEGGSEESAVGESGRGNGKNSSIKDSGYRTQFDDHTFWNSEGNQEENDTWTQRMVDATDIAEKMEEVLSINEAHEGYGGPPWGVARLLKELKEAQTDWKTILENFIQEEINDYSFSPPDRRFDDSPFFLPDFNEKETSVKNVVFLIDTSGSISDSMVQAAYSEIKGAIDQFDGKMEGYLGFCDTCLYDFQPFDGKTDISSIIPKGGGGNDFEGNIRDAFKEMKDEMPASIVFITDGYDEFPDESVARGVPVLWMITNTKVEPPWGKVARIVSDN